jgi:isoleucyl-tRNA synthetase
VIDTTLEQQMYLAQTASSIVLALRRKVNIKVRQPLSQIMIPFTDEVQRENIEAIKSLILNEVNVKELNFVDSTNAMLVKRIKPDFKKLGPRYGKIMKQLAVAVQDMTQADIATLEKEGNFNLIVNGEDVTIGLSDTEIISEDIPGWLVANQDKLTVALDIDISDDLLKEGIARELVNRIQNLRKAQDFEITDRIAIAISSNEKIDSAIEEFLDYIKVQVLADTLEITEETHSTEIDVNDEAITIDVKKI